MRKKYILADEFETFLGKTKAADQLRTTNISYGTLFLTTGIYF